MIKTNNKKCRYYDNKLQGIAIELYINYDKLKLKEYYETDA